MVDEPDDELIAFATRCSGSRVPGEIDRLAAYLDAGVDANLANQKGDTLVTRSALATARLSERTDLLELLDTAGDDPGATP